MPFIRFNLILLLLNLAVYGLCQPPEQYAYTHYKLSDGLASNVVNNMVQDESGFLWLATNNGLQRYDGNNFITINSDTGDVAGLPSDEVTEVYLDKRGNLWVATADNKVGIFNTHTFRYTEVPIKQWSREKVHVDKLFIETADNRLLLQFRKSNKLFQYDTHAHAFVPSTYFPFVNSRKINYIVYDQWRQRFICSTDSGLLVYNPKTSVAAYDDHNPEGDPLITQYKGERFFNYLYMDAAHRLFAEQWLPNNTHPSLHLFDFKTGVQKKYDLQKEYGLSYHQIKGFLQQRSGKLWIFGLPFLARYTGSTEPFSFLKKDYNKEQEPKFNIVYSLFEDRQHNIWVCSDNGVYQFNPDAQLFHNYTLTTPKRFTVEGRSQSLFQWPNGELWVGYRDLGIFCYDRHMLPLPLPASLASLREGKSVWDMHLHSKTGKLWIALRGGQLIIYDTTTKKAQLLAPEPMAQRAITQIIEDNQGNLWLGTQGGNLVKWDYAAAGKNIAAGFSLVKKWGVIEKLFTDKSGYVWVAAEAEGLLKIDPQTNKVVGQINAASPAGYALWNNNPKDMLQYNDSLLVVASGALNIINLNTLRVQHISRYDGLPSNTVQSVVKDASGMLWLGTLNGLCRTDIAKHTFTTYDQRDGLMNESFNVAGAHNLSNGRLLFMTAESFLIFDPSFILRKDSFNTPFITDFKLMNCPLLVDSLLRLKKIKLDYNGTNMMIEFSALNYNKLAKLDYYYQLQNFDTAWIKSDDRHQAIYTYLPPGNYRFKVKTKNIEGIFSPAITYFYISVNPPFWKTWWFYSAIIVSIGLVLYLLDRERMKRLATLHNMRLNIASELHQDVSSTLNNINMLSQIAKLKAEKDIVRSKELIDEISGKSYDMIVSMDDILWSIDPNNDTMEKTLLRILELANTLETASGASIDMVVHEKVKDLRLDMKVRHDFFLVCKEALQYLAQYSSNKNIMVDIDLVRTKIVVKILSVGSETEEGILQMQELHKNLTEQARAMQAHLNFEMGKRDTSIVLTIPVK
ncbi:ligand-binding sensor domain-containing protein [Ilyomonas limi]|nr:two-component regulator propeller domain-containing protein [Ilyomonas limi]